jgi:benzaldehyde dehydrogenase (NAD)
VTRHLVHESIADDYVKALAEHASHLPVGNPDKEEVALGPIINEKQLRRVERIVDDSVSGASVVTAGRHEGLFFEATVLGDVTTSMPAFKERPSGRWPARPVRGLRSLSNGGHSGGTANLERWTEWQWMTSRDRAGPFPF